MNPSIFISLSSILPFKCVSFIPKMSSLISCNLICVSCNLICDLIPACLWNNPWKIMCPILNPDHLTWSLSPSSMSKSRVLSSISGTIILTFLNIFCTLPLFRWGMMYVYMPNMIEKVTPIAAYPITFYRDMAIPTWIFYWTRIQTFIPG